MNLLFSRIRERIGAAIAVVAIAVCFLGMGALLTFVISPQQALEWRRIERLPLATAGTVEAAAPGTEIVITGSLTDNGPALDGTAYVAYRIEEWEVRQPSSSDDDSDPTGSWNRVDEAFPALTLAVDGGSIRTTSASSVNIAGNLHEDIQRGSGSLAASYNGQRLPDGSRRTTGFYDGDLVTVLGQKASTGDLIPARLFGGDRVALVENIRSGARAAFVGGIAMMLCSPVILVGGFWAALFGRRR